jgi:isopenicillin-N epimerase
MTFPVIPDHERLRSLWPLDPTVAHLNHGSFGACPSPVLATQTAWRDRMERWPVAFLARELEGELDRARVALAGFLGADPDGLAFVHNATTGVATVLASLRFSPGDELLTTDHEYNATLNALRATARRDGATVTVVPLPFPVDDPGVVIERVLDAVSPRTRLVLLSHVTSPTALVMPVEALVRELDARGIDTLVDGAHAPGMLPLDLDRLGAAYYTGNAHKWLCAPKGAAFLHVRADRRAAIHPLVTSHGANAERADRSRFRLEFDWTGTDDPSARLSIPSALETMGSLLDGGWTELMALDRTIAHAGRRSLAEALDIDLSAERDAPRATMTVLPLPWSAADDDAVRGLEAALARERIDVPLIRWPVAAALDPGAAPRALLLRLSGQVYVRAADIERLAALLRDERVRSAPLAAG